MIKEIEINSLYVDRSKMQEAELERLN